MANDVRRPELDLRDYVHVLRRQAFTIIPIVAVSLGVALSIALLTAPVYEATAEILVKPSPSEKVFSPDAESFTPQRTVDTEIEVLASQSVKSAVERKLRRAPDVTINPVGETDVISVSARSTKPKRAAQDARVYAKTYIEIRRSQSVDDLLAAGREVQAKIDELQLQLDALPPDGTQRTSIQDQQDFYRRQLDQFQVAANVARVGGAQLVSTPDTPDDPVEPQPLRDGLLALVLGLIVGVGIAFLREFLDDTINSKEDVDRATEGAPVLALIPTTAGWKDRQRPLLVTTERPESPSAEAYRTLRTAVQFLGIREPLSVLQMTSATSGEGKTTTLANLAMALAQANLRVIAVDCDLRRPRLHEFFGLRNSVGFTSVLLGQVPLLQAVQPVRGESSLAILASGPPPPDPSELLSLAPTQTLIVTLRQHCDLVLIDSPPVLPVSDPLVVSHFVDATLVIAKAGSTSRRSLHRTLELLEQVDAPFVGTVLNEIDARGGYDYTYPGYSAGRRRLETARLGSGQASTPAAGASRDGSRTQGTQPGTPVVGAGPAREADR